mgnify:CR=1 FL=1
MTNRVFSMKDLEDAIRSIAAHSDGWGRVILYVERRVPKRMEIILLEQFENLDGKGLTKAHDRT